MNQLNHKLEIENKHLEKLLLYGCRITIERKGNWDGFVTATAAQVDLNGNETNYSAKGLSVREASENLHIAVLSDSEKNKFESRETD